jgi:geranylgeranyl pyrophosphate synthase
VSLEKVIAQVSSLPEVAAWPEMVDIFDNVMSQHRIKLWELPLLACQAVGGEVSAAISGAASISCLQLSLVLVDDMLDEDPRGMYHQLGQAATANLAFAFQSAAFYVSEQAPARIDRRAAINASLARMALTVSFGQHLDTRNLAGEEGYWKIAETKSAPYFGTALQIGALLGKASPDVAQSLCDLGFLIGVNVNVHDDLVDALKSPAVPDWKQGRNNLAILYALTADHPERDQFKALRTQVDDLQALKAAQQILIRCGAVSYCVYHIIKRYQAAGRVLDSLPLADPEPLRELIAGQIEPLIALLQDVGAAVPPELGGLI